MDVTYMDEAERLIRDCRKFEKEINSLSKILESPHRLGLGYLDYGTYSFFDPSGTTFTYELNLEKKDIEALIDIRNSQIADIKKQLGEL